MLCDIDYLCNVISLFLLFIFDLLIEWKNNNDNFFLGVLWGDFFDREFVFVNWDGIVESEFKFKWYFLENSGEF